MTHTAARMILPSDVFRFADREFVANASACEAATGNFDRLDYADGQWFFHIRSTKTGALAKFVRSSEIYDGPRLHSVRFICQEHGGLLATIINR
jgi:hypothetical protein